MKQTAQARAAAMGWGGLVKVRKPIPQQMRAHNIPFQNNPEELIPTPSEMDELRDGFDRWMAEEST